MVGGGLGGGVGCRGWVCGVLGGFVEVWWVWGLGGWWGGMGSGGLKRKEGGRDECGIWGRGERRKVGGDEVGIWGERREEGSGEVMSVGIWGEEKEGSGGG
uniref:Uncharacterized protein n=1 Tax=Knipowitschia caucasica TaxID=637954 RepID=A0AAV2KSH1_KNICA